MDSIQKYEGLSGQKINAEKSELVFGKRVSAVRRAELANIMGFKVVEKFDKYLGMPTVVGRSKKVIFNGIVDRVRRKLQGWKERLLSKPGKEVLIKAVAQSIPTYLMSIFKLLEGVIDALHSAMAKFWWGSSDVKRKLHWVSWDQLCNSKSRGGLGFRNLHDFNQALLAKQVWRIQNYPNALVSRVLKAIYFKRGSILDSHRGYNPSFTWRSIWGAKPVILEGMGWRVGNGSGIGIMSHSWIPTPDFRALGIPCFFDSTEGHRTVADLIKMETCEWDKALLLRLFQEEDVKKILSIPLSRRLPQDEAYWRLTANGEYTVKSGYFLCRARPIDTISDDEQLWKKVWHLNTPPKLIHFIWRACTGMLAVRKILVDRHCGVDATCPLCHAEEESLNHAFFDCYTVRNVWNGSGVSLDWEGIDPLTFKDCVRFFLTKCDRDELCIVLATMWSIWSIRNSSVFEKPCDNPHEVRRGYEIMVKDYIRYRSDVFCVGAAGVHRSSVAWEKPEDGWLKCNVDVAMLGDGSIGLGVVIRNDCGTPVLVACRRVATEWEVVVAEARAMLFGIEQASWLGARNIIMEGDSLNVIYATNDVRINRSILGLCIDDIKGLCSSFESVKFVHVKRSGNTVAHYCARLCLEIGVDVVHVNSFPDAILALAELDMK